MEHQQKEWKIRVNSDSKTIQKLSQEMNVPVPIAELMFARGLLDYKSAESFFHPNVNDLHHPMLMKDMDKACQRICLALEQNEKILIYGDYDVDGTTAVAMMYLFLAKQTDQLGFYIPDRYKEGYGVSAIGIDYAHKNGYSLIITLDCGIRANSIVEHASSHKIDMIICDHHNIGDAIPSACAVLDPQRHDCDYPFKDLSGCGVGFKLIHAVCLERGLSLKENLFCYIDLVAVSIASDIVPVIGENRILAHFGLKKLSISPMPGLKALMDIAGISASSRSSNGQSSVTKDISITDLVFKIGPRINAAGRIESGRRAVDLLIADSLGFAKNIADEIDILNEDRKNLDRSITEEALDMIASDTSSALRCSTVVYSDDWHKGVVGIVASRLIERYYKPTIVLTYTEGKITGSARSVDGFDLYSAIEKCEHLLTSWGGHRYAAGVNMRPENLQAFKDAFEAAVADAITPDQLIPKIYIDAELKLRDVSQSFFRILQKFGPFGPGNMLPVFASHDVLATEKTRAVGADKAHLKLSVIDDSRLDEVDGIGFGFGDYAETLEGKPFSLCYSLDENVFRDRVTIQLVVKDLMIV